MRRPSQRHDTRLRILQSVQGALRKGRIQGLTIGCLLALGAGTACKNTAVASANLDALLDADDHLRHVAPVRSGFRFYMESLLDPRWFGAESLSWQGKPVAVPDPATTALENLLVLAKGRGSNELHRHMIQVRQFSRYALRSSGVLVRERAVLELAPHAQRLGLEDLSGAFPDDPNQALHANAAELSALLAGLIETIEPVVKNGRAATETQKDDFRLACEQVDAERMELDGLWRMLKALETFAGRVDLDRELYEPLVDLSERLQRQSVQLALAGSTIDPAPRVRRAGFVAAKVTFGDEVLAEALLRLRQPGPQEPDRRFGLQAGALTEDFMLRTFMGFLAEAGLPERQTLTEFERTRERIQDLRSLLLIVNEGSHFEAQTRVATMAALKRIVPQGPRSLRAEDWVAWWSDWSKGAIQRLQDMRPPEGASGASTAP